MRNKRSQFRRTRRGSALVETSLVIVVFLVMLIGVADLSLVLFIQGSLGERVRAGLRYGVITYDTTAIRNIVLYGTETPASGAVPSFRLTSDMVQVSRFDANAPEDRVQITVSNYPIEFVTPFIARTVTGKPIVVAQPMELGNLP